MRLRSILRLSMIVLALGVALGVYLQWEPAVAEEGETGLPSGLRGRADDDRAVQSHTTSLDVVKTVNGQPVFSIVAAEQVDFVDGWNEWSEPRLTIHGRVADNDVTVLSSRMRTSGEINELTEVRMLGKVDATLPGNGSFTARRLDYDAVTGVVSGCNRLSLIYAGMLVKADCVHFQTAGDVTSGDEFTPEVLRMWQTLSLRAEDGETGLPPGLRGRAEELFFRPGSEFVTLSGAPRLRFVGSSVAGGELLLDIDLKVNQLRQIEAIGPGELRYVPGAAAGPEMPEDADAQAGTDDDAVEPLAPGAGDGPAHVLFGDRVQIEFGDAARLSAVRAISETSAAARLSVGEYGQLYADVIEMLPGDLRQEVSARGSVRWTSSQAGTGLRELSASVLTLRLAEGKLEAVEAAGEVVAELAGAEAEESRVFRGPKLELGWKGEALVSGTWPEGVAFAAEGRELTAGRADFDPVVGDWVLAGTPRPEVSGEGIAFEAAKMSLGKSGQLTGTGQVVAELAGEHLMAAGALFGGVPLVRVRAGSTVLDSDGGISMSGRVQVVWEQQSLVADRLRLSTDPGQLQASGGVELVAAGQVGPVASQSAPGLLPGARASGLQAADQFITVTAGSLLVEEATQEIRLGGKAMLRQGGRRIEADKLIVTVDEQGEWSMITAEDAVKFLDEQAKASGDSLTYDMRSGELVLRGTPTVSAIFEFDGIEYRSQDALRVVFNDDEVAIEATEDGRTRTNVVQRTIGSR